MVLSCRKRYGLLGFAVLVLGVAPGWSLTHEYDMEVPVDWSDVSMEWGAGGRVDFCIEEPGHPGKALHMTTKPVDDPAQNPPEFNPCRDLNRGQEIANEGRCLQWSHEPGTPVKIAFDFRVFEANDSAWFKVCYYDGYVTGEFFQMNLADPFYAIPDPILNWQGGDSREWKHCEVETPALEYPVLTLWIQAAQSQAPGYLDAAIDNLEVTLTPLKTFLDPGLDWGNDDFDKMHTCRTSNGCRHIEWCDVMYDEFGPAEPGSDEETIYYGSMNTFRGTTGNRMGGLLAMKHDFWHRRREGQAGGASVIGFASIHGSGEAKSMGLRQTVSYAAWDLKAGQRARITVQTKGASSIEEKDGHPAARTVLGVDPYGGVLGNASSVLWSEEGVANIRNQWTIHKIDFEKPPKAEALTIFLKWRDGIPDDTCDDAAVDGNEGWFDWAMVEALSLE
jgi:hypothetical protein